MLECFTIGRVSPCPGWSNKEQMMHQFKRLVIDW